MSTDTFDQPDPIEVLSSLGLVGAHDLARLRGGWDNYLWRFCDAAGNQRVLRLFRNTGTTEALHAVAANEVAAMEAARSCDLPVPDVLKVGDYQGAPALVIEWMDGMPLVDVVKRRPWQARAWGREFGRLQAKLHRCTGAGVRPLVESGWHTKVADPAILAAAEAEMTEDSALCHLDFHPLNVLATPQGISALLDFRNAASGDRRADLGLTWALLEAAPLPPGLAMRVGRVLIRRFAAGWREGYAAEAGSMPLTPLMQAIGLAIYHHEFGRAVAEGRGWATERDVARLGTLLEERKRAAGL
jgi:aminoglycoside phosphotransferase (APT) family kinase protein